MIGERIGAYTIDRKLGEGGMGVVYAATQEGCIREVAVKILTADLSRDHTLVERFFKEVRATTAINHPSIVQVHGHDWAKDGAAYIVMELLAGEPLSARLRLARQLSVSKALTLARQIATALAAAHAAKIIHRDLKPDNVFIVPDPEAPSGERVKLLDFGIAKLATENATHGRTVQGSVIGSPQYMSPEQCEDASSCDGRSDLYSLGCILFEMLSGRPPFIADNPMRLMSMHLQTPPPALTNLVPGLPAEVDTLVTRLLAKAPADRFPSAADVEDALVGCGAVAASTRPTGNSEPLAVAGAIDVRSDEAPAPSRRRWLTVALTVAAVAAIVGGALAVGGMLGASASSHAADVDAPLGPLDAASPPQDATTFTKLDEILSHARAALKERRWASASALAADALAIAPEDPEAQAIAWRAAKGDGTTPEPPPSPPLTTPAIMPGPSPRLGDRIPSRGEIDDALDILEKEVREERSHEALDQAASLQKLRSLDRSDHHRVARLGAMAACQAHDTATARRYYGRTDPAGQTALVQFCLKLGVHVRP